MHEGGCGGNVVNDVSSVNPSSNQNLRTTNHYGDQTNTEQTEGYTYAEQTDNYNAYGTPAVVPPDTSPDSYGGSYTNGLTAAETTQMLTSINEHRTTNGLVALTIDDRLMAAAMAHSEDQAQHCLMGHDGTDGTKPWDRMDRLNYKWVSSAENVCSGQKSVAEAMESWWNSPKHRANILKNDVKNVGFAVAHNEACALFTTYWTQVFGEE
ncbi:unnamed protein product [Peronospora belbahrii]|uniref:SCP domain-containing protein n=1 Tax=Peronospora belbahrii TaxID=622444 RepID=A0AAU9KL20_9STRA|nr:unnamed protein product [Peronospora belbahrii]CAH0514469.1 unnamed protein product [Peronospora belbahrii]